MPPFKPLLPFRHPAFLSLFGLARSQSTLPQAQCTHFLPRQPSPAAPRESPYPLVFLRTPDLEDSGAPGSWKDWSGMFAEKGYLSIEIDIAAPPKSDKPFAMMVGALATQIRTLGIPFPPVIVASGRACLLSQSYIEDYAASGLVLINPPPDEDDRGGASITQSLGLSKEEEKWEWPKFGFEPHFPILVMSSAQGLKGMEATNRLLRSAKDGVGRGGKGVSVEELVDGERGEKSRIEAERWMDRCGF